MRLKIGKRNLHRIFLNRRQSWKRDLVGVLVIAMLVAWYSIDRVKITSPVQPTPETPAPAVVDQLLPASTSDQHAVIRVIDGDTIVLDNGETVRYIGIDTPELTHKPPDCYAEEATARNRELVDGKTVRLNKDTRDKDRYGRLLRYVYVDGQLVNQVLVDEGLARAFAVPPDTSRESDFLLAEQAARTARLGLWGNCDSTRLSVWERTTGERAETAEFQATNSQPILEDTPDCYCDENIYDCKDFTDQAEAQALYDCCWQKTGRDLHLIDSDNNGRACELLK